MLTDHGASDVRLNMEWWCKRLATDGRTVPSFMADCGYSARYVELRRFLCLDDLGAIGPDAANALRRACLAALAEVNAAQAIGPTLTKAQARDMKRYLTRWCLYIASKPTTLGGYLASKHPDIRPVLTPHLSTEALALTGSPAADAFRAACLAALAEVDSAQGHNLAQYMASLDVAKEDDTAQAVRAVAAKAAHSTTAASLVASSAPAPLTPAQRAATMLAIQHVADAYGRLTAARDAFDDGGAQPHTDLGGLRHHASGAFNDTLHSLADMLASLAKLATERGPR